MAGVVTGAVTDRAKGQTPLGLDAYIKVIGDRLYVIVSGRVRVTVSLAEDQRWQLARLLTEDEAEAKAHANIKWLKDEMRRTGARTVGELVAMRQPPGE